MPTPETAEKQAIKQYLLMKGFFHFPILQGMGAHRGIPDIMAIRNCVVYAIEVKAVGKNGRASPQSEHQKNFQKDWEEAGGIYVLGGIDAVMRKIS